VSLTGSKMVLSEIGGQVQPAAESVDVHWADSATLDCLTSPCSIWDIRATVTPMVAAICFWPGTSCLQVSASWCPRCLGEPPTRFEGVCSCVQGRP
jgi:hypothetical protein